MEEDEKGKTETSKVVLIHRIPYKMKIIALKEFIKWLEDRTHRPCILRCCCRALRSITKFGLHNKMPENMSRREAKLWKYAFKSWWYPRSECYLTRKPLFKNNRIHLQCCGYFISKKELKRIKDYNTKMHLGEPILCVICRHILHFK